MLKRKQTTRSTNNVSGYFGVTLLRKDYQVCGYLSHVTVAGKTKNYGTYDTAEEAAKAYDAAAIKVGKPLARLNFPSKVPPGYTPTQRKLTARNTTGYRGVSKKTKWGYQASIKINGKQKYLGLFDTSKQAAVAYDCAAHKRGTSTSMLNFPTMKNNLDVVVLERKRKKHKLSSTGFRGVTKIGETYRARIYINRKPILLGTFDTDYEAALAHDQAILKYNKPITKLNFSQSKSKSPQETIKNKKIKEERKDNHSSFQAEWV